MKQDLKNTYCQQKLEEPQALKSELKGLLLHRTEFINTLQGSHIILMVRDRVNYQHYELNRLSLEQMPLLMRPKI